MSEWTVELVMEDFHAYICSTTLSFNDEKIIAPTHNVFICGRCKQTHLLSLLRARLLRESLVEAGGELAAAAQMSTIKRIKLPTYFRSHPELLPASEIIENQQQVMESKMQDFKDSLCASALIPTRSQSSLLLFDCAYHGKGAHYINQQDWKEFKNNLAESASFLRTLVSTPPVVKAFLKTEIRTKSVKMWESLVHQRVIAAFPKETSIPALKKKERAKSRKHLHKTRISTTDAAVPENTAMNYIVPPEFVPHDILIEYHVCGRKTQYSTEAAAAQKMVENGCPPVYTTYKCPYCPGFHYGAGGGKNSPASLVRSGRRWYAKSTQKANLFMYKIMTE